MKDLKDAFYKFMSERQESCIIGSKEISRSNKEIKKYIQSLENEESRDASSKVDNMNNSQMATLADLCYAQGFNDAIRLIIGGVICE